MNKTELVEQIAQRTDSSKAEAQRYVDTLEKVVGDALKGGEEVQITGFGKFYVQKREAREGINPQTREKMNRLLEAYHRMAQELSQRTGA